MNEQIKINPEIYHCIIYIANEEHLVRISNKPWGVINYFLMNAIFNKISAILWPSVL